MAKETTYEPIYVTRGSYSWGRGTTAIESFVNCFKNGRSLRDFKIIKLPDGATDCQVDGMGCVTWRGSSEEAVTIPFDADFLLEVRGEVSSRLELDADLVRLLHEQTCEPGEESDTANDIERMADQVYELKLKET